MRLVQARALPIVSSDNKLIGQISAGDISLLFEEGSPKMALLDLPCLEYAKRVHEKSGLDSKMTLQRIVVVALCADGLSRSADFCGYGDELQRCAVADEEAYGAPHIRDGQSHRSAWHH